MPNFIRIIPQHLPDYELLDCGGFEKLERFGTHILRRPEPQAVWKKSRNEQEWERLAHASFFRKKGDAEAGTWEIKPGVKDRWWVKYQHGKLKFTMRLGLTSFKHVGIFPEQADNWDFIYSQLSSVEHEIPRVLNLFAYTGGASLAARAAGAETTHVDSVKQVITWSRENMEASQLNDIRWVVEDAFKFVQREVKRGKTYHGIIMDPPAYGRGPDGEKWLLDKQIDELMGLCAQLLEPKNAFLITNLYSMGFSPVITETLIHSHFKNPAYHSAELILKDSHGKMLPLGTVLRLVR